MSNIYVPLELLHNYLEDIGLTLAGYPRNETFHTLNKPKSTCINELTSLDDCVININI